MEIKLKYRINREMIERNDITIVEDTSCVGNVRILQNGKQCFLTLVRRYKDNDRTKDVLAVVVKIDEKWRMCPVHRIVWCYYNGNLEEGCAIVHLDDDRFNCSISNLGIVNGI